MIAADEHRRMLSQVLLPYAEQVLEQLRASGCPDLRAAAAKLLDDPESVELRNARGVATIYENGLIVNASLRLCFDIAIGAT